jgi:hypothetical protein
MDESPLDYLLFTDISIVISTKLPANRINMFSNTVAQSETRHFWHNGRLTVHVYLPEEKLRQYFVTANDAGRDWQMPLIGLSEAGLILINPHDLLDYIEQPASRGWLNATMRWTADEPLTNVSQIFNLFTEPLPEGVTLTQNRRVEYFEYLALLGEQEVYPLRFRISLPKE